MKPETRNQKPETRNQKPETRNQKPETRNQKPETRNQRQKLVDVIPLCAPFSVYIDVCSVCNLKCRFCPTNNSDYIKDSRHTKMDSVLFNKVLQGLQGFDGGVKVVNMCGFGEPLMNPLVYDMITMLKKNKVAREVRITTNGVLLTPDNNKKLVESGIDLVRISVNGLSSASYNNMTGVLVDFDKYISNIKNLYECSRNTGTKIAVKIISSAFATKNDENRFYDIFGAITDFMYVESEEAYWAHFDTTNNKTEDSVNKTIENVDLAHQLVCSYPFTDMMVFANGKVGVCCADWRMDTVVGDASIQPLKTIWNKNFQQPRVAHLTGRRAVLPSCSDCQKLPPDNISKQDCELILAKIKENI